MDRTVKVGRPPGARDTKEKCLVAAEEAFANQGFSGTSFRMISEKVGVSNAAIVHYFGSKRNLYSAVLDRIAQSLRSCFPHLLGEKPSPYNIAILFEVFSDWSFENVEYSMILLRELMENRNRVNAVKKWHMKPVMTLYIDSIEKGKKEGLIYEIDSSMFVFYIMGAITHFSVARPTVGKMLELNSDSETVERFKETIKENIIAMLTK